MNLAVELRARVGSFELDVAFEAPAGVTALFGPSGAGKTLTLRFIAGLQRPEAGRIVVGSRVLLDHTRGIDVRPRDRRVGYLFQQYALFPHLSVAANVAFGLHRSPATERAARVEELLALVGLEEHGARRPHELSGGQQQRAALIRALAPRPELLLLDEPFAALDRRVRRRLRTELRHVQRTTGTPMCLVTHDLEEVRQLSDWVVLYDHGRVLRSGPTGEVLANPGSRAAAELLSGE